MTMGAVGVRGALLEAGEGGGFDLAVRSDAFWVRMTSDAVAGLEASRAGAGRVRLLLDGSRRFAVGEAAALVPRLEVGVRHDAGDAETGTGLEVGAGLRYEAAGVAVEGAVRGLVAHEQSGYEAWGASGSVRIDPDASGRGLSLRLAPSWGNASSGTERLWSAGDAHALAPEGGFESAHQSSVLAWAPRTVSSTAPGTRSPLRVWCLSAQAMTTRAIAVSMTCESVSAKAGGAHRVRLAPSRQGMSRRSTGSSRGARTSTYSCPASAATCWAIWLLVLPGGPQTIAGWRASTRRASVAASSLGRSV